MYHARHFSAQARRAAIVNLLTTVLAADDVGSPNPPVSPSAAVTQCIDLIDSGGHRLRVLSTSESDAPACTWLLLAAAGGHAVLNVKPKHASKPAEGSNLIALLHYRMLPQRDRVVWLYDYRLAQARWEGAGGANLARRTHSAAGACGLRPTFEQWCRVPDACLRDDVRGVMQLSSVNTDCSTPALYKQIDLRLGLRADHVLACVAGTPQLLATFEAEPSCPMKLSATETAKLREHFGTSSFGRRVFQSYQRRTDTVADEQSMCLDSTFMRDSDWTQVDGDGADVGIGDGSPPSGGESLAKDKFFI